MRLLALAPLLALAAAQGTSSLCPRGAPRDTLWIDGPRAYACAAAGPGPAYCITASNTELSGTKDTCFSAADCGGGMCVAMEEGGLRRVCWQVAGGGACDSFAK